MTSAGYYTNETSQYNKIPKAEKSKMKVCNGPL